MTGTLPLFGQAHEAISALRRDLVDPEDGPRISTMRNYRFAIVQYNPENEYALRAQVQRLVSDLMARRWVVLTIDLQKLLLDRIRSQPDDWAEKVIAMEKRMAERNCGSWRWHDRHASFVQPSRPKGPRSHRGASQRSHWS